MTAAAGPKYAYEIGFEVSMTSGVFLDFLTVATTRLRQSFFAALGHSNGRRTENRDRNCAADQKNEHIFSSVHGRSICN
jgi:hypothetical protein